MNLKRFIRTAMLAFAGCLPVVFGPQVSADSPTSAVAYVRGPTEPWGVSGNVDALDRVFGTAGGWTGYQYGSFALSDVFASDREFVFLEGGDGSNASLNAFLTAGNRALIEDWVQQGGSLLIESAGSRSGGDVACGFGGVVLDWGCDPNGNTYSINGYAVDKTHPIFNQTGKPTGIAWAGSPFSRDVVVGTGLATVIVDDIGRAVLAGKDWGTGHVMFSGLTLPWSGNSYWTPVQDVLNLHDNILSYAAAQSNPEPCALTLFGLGLSGLLLRRRQRR